MKLVSLAVAAALLGPSLARAADFDKPSPPLDDLLAKARSARKPLLLDFSAVWCQPCKLLDEELDRPEAQKRLERFVFHSYDAERGAGAEAAARYGVTGYPTLVVVDETGTQLARKVGVDAAELVGWLDAQASALRTEPELEAAVRARPDDLEALWLLARRALASGDAAAARGWLARIEAADRSPAREQAANAAWLRIESELDEKLRRDVRAQTTAYLEKYPAQGLAALKALAASGADRPTVEAAVLRMVAAIDDPGSLNMLSYVALSLGALDGARAAGEKLVGLTPDDPAGLDTLAEVLSYRGERARALELSARAIEKEQDPRQAAALRANLERFKTGAPSPDVPPAGVLPSALTPARGGAGARITPELAATRLYDKNAGRLSAACGQAAKARGLGEIYVRVQLGAAKVEKVEVLEPAATPALRRCVDRAVRGIAVPADQKAVKVTLPIRMGA